MFYFIAKYNFYRTSTNDLRKAIFQIATRAQDDLQNRFTLHKLKKASVIPHPDAESAESWHDVRQKLQSKMGLKAKQILRRGAE